MRIRNRSLSYYGISDEREKELITFCRNTEKQEIIRAAAYQANPSISDLIFENLISGAGYNRLSYRYHITYSRNDFYGYRRLALSYLNELLKLETGKVIG